MEDILWEKSPRIFDMFRDFRGGGLSVVMPSNEQYNCELNGDTDCHEQRDSGTSHFHAHRLPFQPLRTASALGRTSGIVKLENAVLELGRLESEGQVRRHSRDDFRQIHHCEAEDAGRRWPVVEVSDGGR